MTERAFVADAREAKGLHDGSVTCLVRVVDPQPDHRHRDIKLERGALKEYTQRNGCWHVEQKTPCPFGVVGDRLWVQDEWALIGTPHGPRVVHSGERVGALLDAIFDDEETGESIVWRNPSDMHRESCRTLLDVTDVRVVRAQEVEWKDMEDAGLWKAFPEYRNESCIWRDSAEVLARLRIKYFRKLIGEAVFDANSWLWLATVAKVDG